MRNGEREKSERQKDRCQVGVSTVDDRDPCRDGICQFPPCSGLVPLFTPHLCKKVFSFMGFLCRVRGCISSGVALL